MLKIERQWGWWTELFRSKRLCVKILTIKPNHHLSRQRHYHRYEMWFGKVGRWRDARATFNWFHFVRPQEWHQFFAFDKQLKVLEVQFGSDVREDDIERV